jgi:PAS domain S-box-containing protein
MSKLAEPAGLVDVDRGVRHMSYGESAIVIFRCSESDDGRVETTFLGGNVRGLLGVQADDLLGDDSRFHGLFAVDCRKEMVARLREAMKVDRPWSAEFDTVTAVGMRKRLHGVWQPMRQNDGRLAWDGFLREAHASGQADYVAGRSTSVTRLFEDIVNTVGGADTYNDAVQVAVDKIREYTGWPVGHAFHVAGDPPVLEPSGIWSGDDHEAHRTFRQVTSQVIFRPGEGLPGRVLETGRPAWIKDVKQDANFPRARMAGDIGVSAGFAFPVIAEPEVLAVLEFFSHEPVEPDASLLEVIHQVGVTLGEVMRRKRVADIVRQTEATVAGILATAPDAIIAVDEDQSILMVNAATERIFGYAAEELIGRSIDMLIPDHAKGAHGKHVANFSKSADTSRTIPMRGAISGLRKNGEEFPAEAALSKTTQGGVTIFTVYLRDITRRVKVDSALRDSEQKFRGVFDDGPLGMALIDMDRRFVNVNKRLCEILQRDAAEIHLQSVEKITHPDDREPDHAIWRQVTIGKLPSGQIDKRYIRGDYTTVPVAESICVLYDDAGKPQYTLSMIEDVTARKVAQRQLREARDQLEVRLKARTRELTQEVAERKRAEEEAESANQAKTEFVSRMSHELRTPLNAVLGFAQMMRDYPEHRLSTLESENLEQIITGGEHLRHLINDILDLSRLESGQLVFTKEPIELAGILKDALKLIKPLAEERHVVVNEDFRDAAAVKVAGDPIRLKEVFPNVLSNAVKYNREGGSVDIVSKLIDGDMLRICVTDTGQGIPEAKYGEVFLPFSRLGAELSTVEGTGMGLTISQKFMEGMGGDIGFESAVGIGSTFWFDIPVAR